MLRVAPGVRLPREVALVVMVDCVTSVFAAKGFDTWITSGVEGKHSTGSKHYVGHALDWRIKHVPKEFWPEIHREIVGALGGDYDVLLENDPPHIHVEWDPK